MHQLDQIKRGSFDRMFLQMMIPHHQQAIEMATTELTEGTSPDAKTLAQKIINAPAG